MKPTLRVALAAITLLGRLSSAPVAVGDPSFEGNNLSPGGYAYNLGPEWTGTSGTINGNAFEEYIQDFAAEGTDHLGMELGYDVWQDPGVTYQANARYTLTVAAGHRNGATNPGNQSQYLLADTEGTIYATGIFNASGIPAQSFADAPALVFDTPDNPAAVGKSVRILLQARGTGRSHFDNIRLDATSLIPPGSAALENLPPADVGADTATLQGQVTDVGDGAPAITFYWGTADGGLNTANWEHSLALPGTHTGNYSGGISGLAPATT